MAATPTPAQPADQTTGRPPIAAPAAAIAREVDVASIHGEGARVRVHLPASWTARESALVLEESRESIAGVQFDMICEKACGADDIARFPAIVDSTFETAVRPNINSGDPKLDAVRLDMIVVEEGELPDGRFAIARITRPKGLEGPYREKLVVVSVRGRHGEPAVGAQGWAPIEREADLGPILVEACRTFEILR